MSRTFLRPALGLIASALLASGFVAAAVAPAYAAPVAGVSASADLIKSGQTV